MAKANPIPLREIVDQEGKPFTLETSIPCAVPPDSGVMDVAPDPVSEVEDDELVAWDAREPRGPTPVKSRGVAVESTTNPLPTISEAAVSAKIARLGSRGEV